MSTYIFWQFFFDKHVGNHNFIIEEACSPDPKWQKTPDPKWQKTTTAKITEVITFHNM